MLIFFILGGILLLGLTIGTILLILNSKKKSTQPFQTQTISGTLVINNIDKYLIKNMDTSLCLFNNNSYSIQVASCTLQYTDSYYQFVPNEDTFNIYHPDSTLCLFNTASDITYVNCNTPTPNKNFYLEKVIGKEKIFRIRNAITTQCVENVGFTLKSAACDSSLKQQFNIDIVSNPVVNNDRYEKEQEEILNSYKIINVGNDYCLFNNSNYPNKQLNSCGDYSDVFFKLEKETESTFKILNRISQQCLTESNSNISFNKCDSAKIFERIPVQNKQNIYQIRLKETPQNCLEQRGETLFPTTCNPELTSQQFKFVTAIITGKTRSLSGEQDYFKDNVFQMLPRSSNTAVLGFKQQRRYAFGDFAPINASDILAASYFKITYFGYELSDDDLTLTYRISNYFDNLKSLQSTQNKFGWNKPLNKTDSGHLDQQFILNEKSKQGVNANYQVRSVATNNCVYYRGGDTYPSASNGFPTIAAEPMGFTFSTCQDQYFSEIVFKPVINNIDTNIVYLMKNVSNNIYLIAESDYLSSSSNHPYDYSFKPEFFTLEQASNSFKIVNKFYNKCLSILNDSIVLTTCNDTAACKFDIINVNKPGDFNIFKLKSVEKNKYITFKDNVINLQDELNDETQQFFFVPMSQKQNVNYIYNSALDWVPRTFLFKFMEQNFYSGDIVFISTKPAAQGEERYITAYKFYPNSPKEYIAAVGTNTDVSNPDNQWIVESSGNSTVRFKSNSIKKYMGTCLSGCINVAEWSTLSVLGLEITDVNNSNTKFKVSQADYPTPYLTIQDNNQYYLTHQQSYQTPVYLVPLSILTRNAANQIQLAYWRFSTVGSIDPNILYKIKAVGSNKYIAQNAGGALYNTDLNVDNKEQYFRIDFSNSVIRGFLSNIFINGTIIITPSGNIKITTNSLCLTSTSIAIQSLNSNSVSLQIACSSDSDISIYQEFMLLPKTYYDYLFAL